jgi:DNA-binding transcriptional regulator YhcF (GntR family)
MNSHPISARIAERRFDRPGEPLAHLIVEEVWVAVVQGELETGERLPTARQLAIALQVSPGTVERAYAELHRRGVLATGPEGCFVALTPPPEAERQRRVELVRLCRETVARAAELGVDLDTLLQTLSEYRGVSTDATPVKEAP